MLKFEFTIEEANMILGSLGKQPYEAVFPLIKNIQDQAQPQLPALAEQQAAQAAAAESATE